jgi:hypothetical protein
MSLTGDEIDTIKDDQTHEMKSDNFYTSTKSGRCRRNLSFLISMNFEDYQLSCFGEWTGMFEATRFGFIKDDTLLVLVDWGKITLLIRKFDKHDW